LCPSGQTWLDQVTQSVKRNVLFQLRFPFRHKRTRPHKAHVTAQYVEQLRQLIQMPATQHAPNSGDARVIRLRRPEAVVFRSLDHRTKLARVENSAIFADAWLADDNRAG